MHRERGRNTRWDGEFGWESKAEGLRFQRGVQVPRRSGYTNQAEEEKRENDDGTLTTHFGDISKGIGTGRNAPAD